MKKIIISVFIIFLSIKSIAQQSTFEGWYTTFNTFHVSKNVSIHFDGQFRTSDEWSGLQLIMLRPGINFHLTKKLTITAGYAWIDSKRVTSVESKYFAEHRLWQQFIINQKINSHSILHRFRFEERFIPKIINNGGKLSSNEFLFSGRFRYFIRDVIPLSNQKIFSKGIYAAVQNEVFFNLIKKENANAHFLDQNRFFVACGYRLSPKADIDFGYMHQYVKTASGYVHHHILQIVTFLRM